MSLLTELNNSRYDNETSNTKLKACIYIIINTNEDIAYNSFSDFDKIKEIIGYFDIKYPWGKNILNDLIIEEKLNKLYNLFN
jgi:hypothetical protein